MSKGILQSAYNTKENWCPYCVHGPALCIRYIPKDGNCLFYTDGVPEKGPGLYLFSKKKRVCWWYLPDKKCAFMTTSSETAQTFLEVYWKEGDLRYMTKYFSEKSEMGKLVKVFISNNVYKVARYENVR